MSSLSNYDKRGVSSSKKEVHEAIKYLDKGLFPNAFCKIIPDFAAGNPEFCNLMHADTAGTKTSLAYLYWKETGNISVWKDIVQDAIVMNIDDMACAGCLNDFILSSTIGRNKMLIPGEVLTAIINGTSEFSQFLNNLGFDLHLAGGETADVGDIVRVVDIGFTAFSRMKRDFIFENNIQNGSELVVLSSSGQSTYESKYNSGIGCNGLTSARHDVLNHSYAINFPESFDSRIEEKYVYSGSKSLLDTLEINETSHTIGSLLLSPTRTYLPFIRDLFKFQKKNIQGLIHCTGGGQTKVLNFIKNKKIIKNNLLPIPPIFDLIQAESNTNWSEMYSVFNMGQRLEVYVPKGLGNEVVDLANSYHIEATIAGYVENSPQNEVVLESKYGAFITAKLKHSAKRKAKDIEKYLDYCFPETPIPLAHKDPYTLLIAVLLSAQCTDERVNKVTPSLFELADNPLDMSYIEVERIKEIIRPCGLSPKKSLAISNLSAILVEKYKGKVPKSFEALESLPGVGHKTASVVMSQAFGVPAFPVDTHIHRLATRWGLTSGKNVEETEKDLKILFPKKNWNKIHLQIIFYGRKFCPARGHILDNCPICSALNS